MKHNIEKIIASIAILIIFTSFAERQPLTYTATTAPIQICTKSIETERKETERNNALMLAAMLINAAAQGEGIEGQREIWGNLNARIECGSFPNTMRGVIFQDRQYQEISSKLFRINSVVYKRVLKWSQEEQPYIGFLFFYNPEEATNKAFVKWAETFVLKGVGKHLMFGQCGDEGI
jgi:spore germination cell wall hydrolase CwlJ-like protein